MTRLLPAAIASVCREHFGPRCGSSPLRTPCLASGSKQPRSLDELAANRAVFVDEALTMLRGRA